MPVTPPYFGSVWNRLLVFIVCRFSDQDLNPRNCVAPRLYLYVKIWTLNVSLMQQWDENLGESWEEVNILWEGGMQKFSAIGKTVAI